MRQKFPRFPALVLALPRQLLTAALLAGATASAPAAVVIDPALPVAGIHQDKLAEHWWQWIFGLPEAGNPVLDPDGSAANTFNSGPVFFVAGNFGGDTTRSFTVPSGRPIFFPVVNTMTFELPTDPPECLLPGVEPVSCMLAYLTPAMDQAVGLFATLDGQDLLAAYPSFRQTSTALFDLTFPAGNLLGDVEPGFYPATAVSDGYWVALEGLEPGPHTLRFGGTNGNGFTLAVTSSLLVSEPAAVPLVLLAGLMAVSANRRAVRQRSTRS